MQARAPIYNDHGQVTTGLLRAELLAITGMVAPGSVADVLERIEALAIELHHYNQGVKRAHAAAESINLERTRENA